MFSLSFLLDHARRFVQNGVFLLTSLLDEFLNLSPDTGHPDDDRSYSDDPFRADRRSRHTNVFWSLPWMKAAGLATAGQFLLGLLNRLPLTGMLILVGGVAMGLVMVSLDADTLENLRQKLSL